MEPVDALCSLGTQTEAPRMVKVWKTKDTVTVPVLAMDLWAMITRARSPTVPGMGTIHWNLQWDGPAGCVSYFVSLGGRNCPVCVWILLF